LFLNAALQLFPAPDVSSWLGIAISSYKSSVTKQYSAWGRCLRLWHVLKLRMAYFGASNRSKIKWHVLENVGVVRAV
jgi:hypothetical protein